MRIKVLASAAALCILVSGGAFAFDAATPDASPGAGAPAANAHVAPRAEDAGARSAKSIECSQKADAQNLHGKPRRQFMRECKHGA
jgi:hypothetical protein